MSHIPQAYDPYYPVELQHQIAYNNDGVNTLFVSGLPDDVKPREIHNLFRRRPGFDFCQLKYTGRGNQVVAFATFFNHQSAISAMHSLNGVKFDPQTGSTLHIELARSNSRRKRKPGSEAYVVIDNRNKKPSNASSGDEGSSDSDEVSDNENADSTKQDDSEDAKSEEPIDPDNVAEAAKKAQEQSEKTTDEGGHACSTLFIANLGPTCTEDELKQVLSQYPGFNVLKLRARGGMPVAFADFKEIEQATQAMTELQSTMLPSSDRGGLHIEYARSKMRKHGPKVSDVQLNHWPEPMSSNFASMCIQEIGSVWFTGCAETGATRRAYFVSVGEHELGKDTNTANITRH